MTECNKTTTVAELPSCDSISRDSYLIVQGENQACKVKISDFVLGNENVDFYSQIEELVNKVNDLTAIIQTNSGSWNETATTVSQNKSTWDNASDVTNINTRLDAGESKWSDTSTAVELNSANWENTYLEVDTNKDKWTYGYDVVNSSQHNWNQAYTISLGEGVGAIHEALEIISTSPWFQQMANDGNGTTTPTRAQVYEVWSSHQLYGSQWNSVVNTVMVNSANWS